MYMLKDYLDVGEFVLWLTVHYSFINLSTDLLLTDWAKLCKRNILHTFVYYSNRSAQTVSEWALDVNPKH